MGLFRRFNDIITANLNDLVDRFEDPEKGLKQAVCEMEESIQTATMETAKVLANQKRLEKEISRAESENQKWTRQAEHCVELADDNGARHSLVKAAETAKLLDSLSQQIGVATDASNVLKEQLTGMRAKVEEAKRGLATLSARSKAAEIRKSALASTTKAGNTVSHAAAFDKFERLREKVETAEAEAEALAEITGQNHSPISTLQPDIESQLAALKARQSNG